MVVDRFPMFRLATLVARQLSSPIAARIKRYAVTHPRFGAAVCIRIAKAFHWCEWRTRAWSLGLAGVALTKNTRPPFLPARTAINLGGDLLGEIIIFSLGSLIIIFEVNRQASKQDLKDLNEKSHWLAISLSLEELVKEVTLQQVEIERMHAALLDLQFEDQESHLDDGGNLEKDNIPSPEYSTLTSFEPVNRKIFL